MVTEMCVGVMALIAAQYAMEPATIFCDCYMGGIAAELADGEGHGTRYSRLRRP